MGRQTSLNSCSDNKFFSISNFHGGYKYVWAGLNPDWFHWGSSRGPKTIWSSPAQTHSHFLWDAKLPYNHCSDTKFFSISNFHGGYKYVWAGLNPDWFHWGSSRGPKTIQSSPAQTHSHFLWDAKLPYILNQTINSSPSQTSMAATNMFEPGWILIGFIEDRLGDPKQFNPARLKPFPFSMGRQTSLYSMFRQKFFSNSNFHGGYKYVWAGLNPDWFHWGSSRGPKQFQSSPAQTHSHFLWDAKLPYIHCNQTLNSSPSQTSMAATNMFEPGWILIVSLRIV